MGTALAIEDFVTIIRDEKEYLQHQFYVGEIGIFGSFSRHEQQEDSDVDVLVDFSHPVSLLTIIALENYLSSKFNRKVDVVPRDDIRSELRFGVMQYDSLPIFKPTKTIQGLIRRGRSPHSQQTSLPAPSRNTVQQPWKFTGQHCRCSSPVLLMSQ